jgi:hypothetical protein
VLDELRRLQESKTVASAKPPEPGKTADIALVQTQRRFRTAQRQHAKSASKSLAKEIESFNKHLLAQIRSFQKGQISRRRLEARASIAFKTTAETAYRLGMKAVGLVKPTGALYDLTTNDKKWLASYLREELGYFKKFVSQAKRLSDKAIQYRVGLYTAAMRSIYESGRILSVGPNVLITWVLQSDDPCPDCRLIAKHNPYTVENLPTTPKAGQTRCRGNCYCTLKVDKVSSQRVAQVRKRQRSGKWHLKRIKDQQKKRKK